MNHHDDLALTRELLSGDQAAFGEFYDSYFGRVYRFCNKRVSDSEACKDIVQQTFINAMRYLDTYRGEASLHTWICQICRNEISTWYKKTGAKNELLLSFDQNPNVLAALESVQFSLQGTDSLAESVEIRDLVQTVLDSLPEHYAKLLEWKYIEGLSVQEISGLLNKGDTSTQSLLERARKNFRTVFNDLEQELKSGEPATG